MSEVMLDRDLFLRSLIRELSGTLQEVVGLQEASGFTSVVGQRIGDQINQQFRLALGREELDRPQVGELLVDLKRRIQRDFSIVAQDDERIVLSNKAGAQAAPSMLAAAPDEVELLVTDHNMPGMTGLALAAEVRRLHPGLPVILTSGYLSGDLHRGAVALDDVKLLNKEDSFDKLSALIDAMLGGR